MVKDETTLNRLAGRRINAQFPDEIVEKIKREAAEQSIKPGTRLRQIVIEYFRRKERRRK